MASVLAVIALHAWSDDGETVLGRLREALRDDGFVIVGLYLSAVVIGCVSQLPAAAGRRARLGFGWLVAAAFIAYGLAVAGMAALLAEYAPDFGAGSGRSDPGGIYGAMLVCLLGGPALMALSGAVFPGRSAGETKSFWGDFSGMALISAMLGGATLILLLTVIAVR